MKKFNILIFTIILLLFVGCEKEDPGILIHKLFVNVYHTYSESSTYGDKIAEPSKVYIFKDEGKTIRYDLSDASVAFDIVLTYSDETKSEKPVYYSDSDVGVNIFENIENGKYIVWISYYPFSPMFRFSTSKAITVTKDDYEIITFKPLLDCDQEYGYQSWVDKK